MLVDAGGCWWMLMDAGGCWWMCWWVQQHDDAVVPESQQCDVKVLVLYKGIKKIKYDLSNDI